MAHEIENEMIAYSGELPWHGIGAELKEGSTPAEFLAAAKLDWTLDRMPLLADLGNGKTVKVPDRFAMVRSSDQKVMTIAGKSWKPLQNSDTLDFMKRYCVAGGATMETAGGLRDGRVVWALARLNHDFEVRPGDKVKGYILITSPHVVGQSISIRTTTVRVVCANTMAMANYSGKVEYRQNHLSEFDVESAKMAVESAHENLAAAEMRAKTIDTLKLTLKDSVAKVLVPVFAPALLEDAQAMKKIMDVDVMPKNIQMIVQSMSKAPGAIEGTGWGTLNGVTHWADHVAGREAASRMFRSWVGDLSRDKRAVEQKLFDMAS